jgi:hypothetical protein
MYVIIPVALILVVLYVRPEWVLSKTLPLFWTQMFVLVAKFVSGLQKTVDGIMNRIFPHAHTA